MSIISAKVVGVNVSYETYSAQAPGVSRGHKEFIMSRSELIDFSLCHSKWLASADEDDDDTPAMLFGRLVECLEMSPETFDDLFEVHPANYPCDPTKRDPRTEKPWTTRADYCKEWEEERRQDGLTPISPKLKAKADAAVKAAQACGPRAELVACSKKQVHVVGEWQDRATQLVIPIRCLIDLVPDAKNPTWGKALGNSKTARNGDPNTLARVIDDLGYDAGAALDTDLYTKATGQDRTDYLIPVQENTPPYHVVFPMPALSAEFITYGRCKYQIALREYAQCLATKHWPSYSTGGRLVVNGCQYISPDTLWKYREAGGAVASRMDYEAPPLRETEEQGEVTP